MALTYKIDVNGYKDETASRISAVIERIIAALVYAGEEFVTDGRNQPQGHESGYYNDQTVNLRNSIGYQIYQDGQMIRQSSTGFQEEIAATIAPYVKMTGFQLFGFAGMNYASYVEAKGYNVITVQAEACIVNITEYMDDIQKFIDGQ